MMLRHVLTTTPSQRGVPRRSRETAEAVMVKEKGVVVVVAGKALDLLPGAAPGAHVVLGSLVDPAALEAQEDHSPEVPPEMEGETSVVTTCKGSVQGRIASSIIRPLAGAGRKEVAAKRTATTCVA